MCCEPTMRNSSSRYVTIVDEKLQTTLNTRLDSSFKLVSERLEQVQRGLRRDATIGNWRG